METIDIKCPTCEGTGEIEDNGPKACTSCGGNGTVEVPSDRWIDIMTEKPNGLAEHVRIKLFDGSELNVLTQADGDFWFEPLQAFVTPEKVAYWKYRDKNEFDK